MQSMIDANGDGSITEQEFMLSAKQCMAADAQAKERNNAELLHVLSRMSAFLTANQVNQDALVCMCLSS